MSSASSVTDLKHLQDIADAIRQLCRVTEEHGQRSPETQQAAIAALDALADGLPLLNKCRSDFGCYRITPERLARIEEWATLDPAEKAEAYDYFCCAVDLTSPPMHEGGPYNSHSWGEQLDYWMGQLSASPKGARQAGDKKADGERLALDYTGGGIVDISCPPRPPAGAPESERLEWLVRRCKTLQVCFSGPARHYPNCTREEARDWLAAAYSAAYDWLPPATVGECEHLATFDAADRNPSEARAELARLARAATTRLLELHQAGGKKAADGGQAEADTPPKSSAADHEELRRMEAADPVLSEPPQYRDTTWPGVFIEAGGSIPVQWRAGADKKWHADYAALADRAEDMAADRRESPARRKAARELAGLLKQYLAFGTPKKKGGWFVAWGPEARKHLDKMDRVGSPMQALAVRLGLASSSQPVYVPSATVRGRTLDDRLARQKQITKAWAAKGARSERNEKAGARKPAKPKSHWELDTKRQRVRVGGKWYDLSDEQKCVLSVLIAAKGAWVQGRDLGKRPDKTIKAMPKPVQRIIESRKGTGYGYRLPALLPE